VIAGDKVAFYWGIAVCTAEMRVFSTGPGTAERRGTDLLMTGRSSLVSAPPPRRRRIVISAAGLTLLALCAVGYYLWRDAIAGGEASAVRLAIDQGRVHEAAVALEHWLKVSPSSAEAHYLKAQLAWSVSNLRAVEEELTRAAELGYSEQQLARLKGLLFARADRKSEAERLLRYELDATRGADPEVAEALVGLYMGTFRLHDAAAVLERWMQAKPEDARPYLLQAEIDLRTQASTEVIIGRYQQALARDGSLNKARLGLAKQLHMSHRFAEAAAEYATYIARQPEDPLGYLGAGQNALDMGDEALAESMLENALALAPGDSEAIAARAMVELHRGQLEKALALFDRAVAADPYDHLNRHQRMLVLSRLGRKAEAELERGRVERLKSENDRFTEVSRALLRNPLDPKLRSEAASWLMAHGRDDEAVDWANLVLQSEPTHAAMNRLLADHYRKKGQAGLANFYEAQIPRPAREVVEPLTTNHSQP
jgi:tetratricopeptide (TPR) repeat protein